MSTLVWTIIWIGIPFIVAAFIAHMVHLPEFTKRVALVVYVAAFVGAGLFPLSESFRPGIDLSGGTILVYQVEKSTPPGFQIGEMASALHRRVDPAGLMDVTIRTVGTEQIEIIIPRAKQEDVARCKRILTKVGSLEFRILANRRDHAGIIQAAENTFPSPLQREGKVTAKWLPVAPSAEAISDQGEIVVRSAPDEGKMVLAVVDQLDVTGELLSRAQPTVDEFGRPSAGFHFGMEGARRFAALTGANAPDSDGFERRLAIVMDGEVYSAPALRDRISADGIITGDFTQQEVDDLVGVLNAGSLPASLESTPASELSIGPTLGRDTVQSGMTAMVISTAVVLLFMALYYRLAGLVADFAVVLNVLIVVGTMSWVHAAWTLPGLAGLALSVGMAVDANVLIFERLREEQARTKSLRQAIEYAFSRALRPILDSNATTLLAGAILYWIGSEEVRGFALTLIIGLLANLFTAVFVCRLVFDIIERNGWKQRFGMFRLFHAANFNFVGKRWIAVAGSCLLVVVGMTAVGMRGRNLLDIDFTGGTLAAVTFKDPTDSATVRSMAGRALPDVAVEELQLSGEPQGQHFIVRTTLQDQEKVKTCLMRQFGEMLATTRMEVPSSSGGNRVMLSFNRPVTLSAIQAPLEDHLVKQGLSPASRHYRLTPVDKPNGALLSKVELETDLRGPVLERTLRAVGDEISRTTVFERLDNFGGQVARQAQVTAGLALSAGMAAIVVYLWIRFQNVLFGLGAVIALVHDVLVVLGLVAASQWVAGSLPGDWLGIEAFKINLPMVAAFLTLVGYSVNDTIVVFDRIREIRRKTQRITWEMINAAVNQTLSRTLLTGLTTWIVALILYAFGGAAIHGFAFCLVLGVLVGTYSSIYVASPLLIWLSHSERAPSPAARPTIPPSDTQSAKKAPQVSPRRTKHNGGKGPKRRAA
jgi:SecD/SecF fusion protein